MEISIWDIFKYIYKWKYLIMLIVILSILFAYLYVDKSQTYSAEIVIKYTNENAAKGQNPKGEPLDVYEMLSPAIIDGAIRDLNLKTTVSAIRTKITITPIIPTNIVELQKSKLKTGEEYTYNPIDYSVKYVVGASKSGVYARDILEAIIKNYNIYYAQTYLNPTTIPSIDYDTTIGVHDYLEITEIMSNKVKSTIDYLADKAQYYSNFRSTKTGLTFADLQRDYTVIDQYDLPTLFSDIFTGKITVNKELLLKAYSYRVSNLTLEGSSKNQQANLTMELMKNYAKVNIPSAFYNNNGSNDTNNNNNVYDSYYNKFTKPAPATYDELVDKYVNFGVDSSNLNIDADYCKDVLAIFSGADASSDQKKALTEKVETNMNEINGHIKALYTLTDATIRDFNTLVASQHIKSLSSVNIIDTLSLRLYILIAFVIGLCFGLILAIVIEIIKKMRLINKEQNEKTILKLT